jgi:subfamily B ATP-binding cassette protein MsbA
MQKLKNPTAERLINYIKPYKSRFVSALLFMVGVGLLTSFTMWLIKPVLNEIFANKKVGMILPLGGAIVLATFLKSVFSYIQAYLMSYIGQRIVIDIRDEVFSKLCDLSMNFYGKNTTGKLMSKLTNDIAVIQQSVTNLPANAIKDGVTLISLIVLAFYLNWKLAIIAIFVFPIAMYPFVIFGKKLRSVSKQTQKQMEKIYNVLFENISGIKVIKAFMLEKLRKDLFHEENQKYFNLSMRSSRVLSMSSPVMEFIGVIGVASIIVIGGYQVTGGILTQGDFFAFIAAIVSLYAPIKGLSNFNNTFQQSLSAATRVFEILDEHILIQEIADPKTLNGVKNSITYEHITFKYESSKNMILDDISFEIKKGEVVAFVGPSGGGKTTIMNLMPRFFDPIHGRILIDGIDISDFSFQSLRKNIGIVSQDIILFNDTIKQNIQYGNFEKNFDDILDASKTAYVDEFVQKLPLKYDTIIGEGGSNLSGGQKQRIAIARAILKDPAILILDEATSALDNESESLVQEALDALMSNRTTFVVAHRLSTIRKADRVFVIENGKIKETGTHDALLELNGLYAKLYNIQFDV